MIIFVTKNTIYIRDKIKRFRLFDVDFQVEKQRSLTYAYGSAKEKGKSSYVLAFKLFPLFLFIVGVFFTDVSFFVFSDRAFIQLFFIESLETEGDRDRKREEGSAGEHPDTPYKR